MSKIIIVEGVDNCGKDHVVSLIHDILKEHAEADKKLIKNYYNITETHCLAPTIDKTKYNTSLKMEVAMGHYYSHLMEQNLEYCFKQCDGRDSVHNYIIMNRSFLSEYVYSQMYRGAEEQHASMCQDMVYRAIMNKLYSMYGDSIAIPGFIYNNIVFVYCSCPTAWSLKHEDGDSASNSSEALIKDEKRLFETLYDKCTWMNKFVYNTTMLNDNSTCRWKDDETARAELKMKLNL